MVPCAYLRVFEPLDAFPEADRERWGRYVAAGNGLSVRGAASTESRVATARLLTGRQPSGEDAALVRRVGRRMHLCPLQLEERHAVALLAFRDMLPGPAVDAFVSPSEARAAMLAARRLERPPHIMESSWEVPLRWFVAFDPSERRLVDPPEGRGPRVSYLTGLRAALGRLDRAVDVVDGAIEDGDDIVDALADLVDWLTSFDEDSLLELDYGGLNELFSAGDLATDLSCEEIWRSIDCLERGDAVAALAGYEAAVGRWQRMRVHHRTN